MLSVKAEPSLTSMNEDDDGDEDDGDDDGSTPRGEFSTADFSIDSSTDRKKRVHLKCEQQRREAIKTGYAELKEMLPSDFAPLGYKMTNAAILFRTVDYIQKLQQTDRQQSEELVKLRSQLSALQIICQNYENLVSQQGSKSAGAKESACAQQKFKIFQGLLDRCFLSFDRSVQTDSYASITGSLLAWLEKEADLDLLPSAEPSYSKSS